MRLILLAGYLKIAFVDLYNLYREPDGSTFIFQFVTKNDF